MAHWDKNRKQKAGEHSATLEAILHQPVLCSCDKKRLTDVPRDIAVWVYTAENQLKGFVEVRRMYLFHCNYSRCSESPEIRHADSFCVKMSLLHAEKKMT